MWKVKHSMQEHGVLDAENEIEDDAPDTEVEARGRTRRQKGWCNRCDVEAKLNTVNMTAWVHKECDIMDEQAITKLQEAWNSSDQKDKCTVRMDEEE